MSQRRANRLNRLRREKRGVVLLVVVSLLTLFLMIGVTYVLIAGNYQNASAQNQRAHRYGDEPEREMEEVLGQILYGSLQTPTSPRSVIGPHSLLGDLYGTDGVILGTNGQPVTIHPTLPNLQTFNAGQSIYFEVDPSNFPTHPIPNYYAGRVITFTSGPAAGLSTRIMAYYPAGNSNAGTPGFIIEAPESDLPIPVQPNQGSRFVINGAPFNGTGAGFNAVTQNLDAVVSMNGHDYGVAYLPNAGLGNLGIGGLDETWDAPDYQNPFLAMVPTRKLSQFDVYPLLPSFHRPDLVRFWIQSLQQSGGILNGLQPNQATQAFLQPYGPDGSPASGDELIGANEANELVALKRMILFRPLREDHPNFTGGNQNFLETNLTGPYDVDNDGDGITDSIWIDSGLPVVTAPNGRRYKRLVAVLIKDLDGRVNPSVHGNMALATIANTRTSFQITDTFAGMDPAGPTPVYLPRGLGYGPSEVDFRHILNDDAGVYNNLLLQRYFPTPNPTSQAQFPGFSNGTPTDVNNDDGWSRLRTIGMPSDHTIPSLSAYSTPPDVWGRAAIAVDYTGQPIWGFAGTNERIDDPYEVQWDSLRASVDAPYTVAELESLLRYHDLGTLASPGRLLTFTGGYLSSEPRGTPGNSQIRRESFGMGSYIPAPKMIVPRELRQQYYSAFGSSAGNNTILDLYYAAIITERGWNPTVGSNPSDPNYPAFMAQMQAIVPFEILKGQMFNLNRELGNGQDDNGNGVVDDPGEFGGETIQTTVGARNFDYFNDSVQATTYNNRQMMARHLYCMMMLLRNRNWQHNEDLNHDGMTDQKDTARFFAQWAINVIDFRDPDSIMTAFEYDSNPFNGWDIDGDPQTDGTGMSPENVQPPATGITGDRGLVWGVERPELLISETLAIHDRRTEDLSNDQFNGMDNRRTSDPGMERDGTHDFDQQLKPWGAAFVEVYNPWFDRGTSGNQNTYDHKASELYSMSANGTAGVDLSRLSPNGNSPVWRMLIVRGQPNGEQHYAADPDSPQPEALTEGAGGGSPVANYVDRTVYFADLNSTGSYPSGGQYGDIYFPSGGIPRAPVLPGRYAVVGSSGNIPGIQYTTTFGRLNAAMGGYDPTVQDYADTRRIVLNPNVNPDNSSVQISDNLTAGSADIDATTILPVVALPIDSVIRGGVAQSQSFNISEPAGGYPAAFAGTSMYAPPGANDEGHYEPPVDQPFDAQRMDDGQVLGTTNQTVANYRTVHLQRLANPLLGWNALTNPYITVDKSSFDVTPFNGVSATPDPSVTTGRQNLQTFQRGGRFNATDAPPNNAPWIAVASPNRLFRDLWPQEDLPMAQVPTNLDSPAEGTGPHNFARSLHHTIGFLNKRYQPGLGAVAGIYRGAPSFQDSSIGGPAATFPYFAFNNRPYNNPMELLNVPCWSASSLLKKFSFQNADPMALPGTWNNMYQPQNPQLDSYPYGHILNFFHSDANGGNTAPEMSRLFDFVETRTPYSDTEKYYQPDQFLSPNPAPSGYRPPFNYLSRFREPGRININTILDDNVWNSAVRGSRDMCTLNAPNEGDGGRFRFRWALNRQGWGADSTQLLTLNYDPSYPSYFSNPFRTADSGDMMPQNPNSPPPQFLPRKSPANGGLLRQDPYLDSTQFNDPILAPPTPPPLPQYPQIDGNQPLFANASVSPHQDAARNPYFRFQPLQKVANLFSTNSNCYAVWMTIGYFEVESNPGGIDSAHPDGLRLAQEVGVDEGNVKRHRAFYIIDRSVPVAFEPGHRHNTDKAVLLKRFIE
ncbi:MAG: hypothetical protein ACKVP0_27915 [Pirellulaceae bacterium]